MRSTISVPGRVNLIGEHIDYHNLPVLPMAIGRRVEISFRSRDDRRIRATSPDYGERDFIWEPHLESGAPGDWVNYMKAAAQAVSTRWGIGRGMEATVSSDLPPACGLSSSSALLTGFVLALLEANGVRASFEELMDVLPEGEHFVGTRGGGMDHAAVLASRAGCALRVGFQPVTVEHVPIPVGWLFLIVDSGHRAEKSGALLEEYNLRRTVGQRALDFLGLRSYADAVDSDPGRLDAWERRAFLHVTGEALRVKQAVQALRECDAETFGRLLNESHESLRDQLAVSTPTLDDIVETAREAGGLGARLTGAGFGGCAVIFGRDLGPVRAALADRYRLIDAEPSDGAIARAASQHESEQGR